MLRAQLMIEEKQTDPEVIRLRYSAADADGRQLDYDGVFFLNPEGGVATAVIGRDTPQGTARPRCARGSYSERNGRVWDRREELFQQKDHST